MKEQKIKQNSEPKAFKITDNILYRVAKFRNGNITETKVDEQLLTELWQLFYKIIIVDGKISNFINTLIDLSQEDRKLLNNYFKGISEDEFYKLTTEVSNL